MRLAEIDLERQEALTDAHSSYLEAYDNLMVLIDKFPPAHRTPERQTEVSNASNVCTVLQMKYEIAKSERYKVKT